MPYKIVDRHLKIIHNVYLCLDEIFYNIYHGHTETASIFLTCRMIQSTHKRCQNSTSNKTIYSMMDRFLFYGPTKCLKSDFQMIPEIEIIVYSTIGTVLFFEFGFHDSEIMRCLKIIVAQVKKICMSRLVRASS
jgi:hypothetical protein